MTVGTRGGDSLLSLVWHESWLVTRVYLLQHLHLLGEMEDVKTLGVYSSRASAMSAVERFRKLPGFRDLPALADTSALGPAEGFYIDEYELDQDSWPEGYETV
jgi:hypothetical protein